MTHLDAISDNTALMWRALAALPASVPVGVEHGDGTFILRAEVAGEIIRVPLLTEWLEGAEDRHRLGVAVRLFRRRVQAALHGRTHTTPVKGCARHRSTNLRPGYNGYVRVL